MESHQHLLGDILCIVEISRCYRGPAVDERPTSPYHLSECRGVPAPGPRHQRRDRLVEALERTHGGSGLPSIHE